MVKNVNQADYLDDEHCSFLPYPNSKACLLFYLGTSHSIDEPQQNCPTLRLNHTAPTSTGTRGAVDDLQHHMSLRTSLSSRNRYLALDCSIRVLEDALSDFVVQAVNRVGRPSMKILGTHKVEWLGELAFASSESRSEVLVRVSRRRVSLCNQE